MKAWEVAYRAWQRAAARGYGNPRGGDSPARMAKIDANIRRLKARYEALLLAHVRHNTNG